MRGWKIRVAEWHADARGDRKPYQQSIDDIELIVERMPRDHVVIFGADVQEHVGPQRAFHDPEISGEHAMGHRGWNG